MKRIFGRSFIAILLASLVGISTLGAPVVWSLETTTPQLAIIEAQVVPDTGKVLPNALTNVAYWVIFSPVSYLTSLSARVFDYFAELSINSRAYNNANEFIIRGWALVRDITNIFFIIGLLYIAGASIFSSYSGASTSQTKRFLVSLVVAAIFVNFSLFVGRVVVDLGNLTARAFYNNIQVQDIASSTENPSVKPISELLLNKFKPQAVLNNPTIVNSQSGPWENTARIFLVLGLMTFIHIVLLVTFLSVGVLFVGRLIALWLLMIISPFAIAIMALPPKARGVFGAQNYSFSAWLSETVKQSFMAPIFMFFLYLIILFLDVSNLTGSTSLTQSATAGSVDILTSLFFLILPFMVVITLLNIAKKQAKDLSSKFSKAAISTIGQITGAALGIGTLAVGGVGRVLGGAAGRGIQAFGSSQVAAGTTRRAQATNRWGRLTGDLQSSTGRLLRGAGKRAQTSSWDLRNITKSSVPGVARLSKVVQKELSSEYKSAVGSGSTSSYQSYEKAITEFLRKAAEEDKKDIKQYSAQPEKREVSQLQTDIKKAQEQALETGTTRVGSGILKDEYKKNQERLEKSVEEFKKVQQVYKSGDKEYDDARDELVKASRFFKLVKEDLEKQPVSISIGGATFSGTLKDAKSRANSQIDTLQKTINEQTKQNLETLAEQVRNASTINAIMGKLAGVGAAVGATTVLGATAPITIGGAALAGVGGALAGGTAGSGLGFLGGLVTNRFPLFSQPRKTVADEIIKDAEKIGTKPKGGVTPAPPPTAGGTPTP